MKLSKFVAGQSVFDLIDKRVMKIKAFVPPREGKDYWSYQLEFNKDVHANTGTGTWRSEENLKEV